MKVKLSKEQEQLKDLAEEIYDLYALAENDLLPVLYTAKLFGLVQKINKITGVDEILKERIRKEK